MFKPVSSATPDLTPLFPCSRDYNQTSVGHNLATRHWCWSTQMRDLTWHCCTFTSKPGMTFTFLYYALQNKKYMMSVGDCCLCYLKMFDAIFAPIRCYANKGTCFVFEYLKNLSRIDLNKRQVIIE